MGWYRIYIDKEINAKGEGGEHARVFDCEAETEGGAREQVKLKKGEVVNQVVSIYTGTPVGAGVIQADAITRAIASELMASMDLQFDDAFNLAREAVAKAGVS